MYASVIVDIGNTNIDRTYTYEIPEDMEVFPGHRVMVRFGNGNRPTEGFVVAVMQERPSDIGQIKPIIRTLESYPVMLSDQLKLAKWITDVYKCLYVDALRLMIPSQIRGGHVKEKRVSTVAIAECIDIEEYKLTLYRKDGKVKYNNQLEILEMLQNSGRELSISDINCLMGKDATSTIKTLIKKGVLTLNGRVAFRTPFDSAKNCAHTEPLPLSEEQSVAFNAICEGLNNRGGKYLLHGVTGSGKTEVYMQAIMKALDEGGTAIMLVPEISLTPQTVERFRARFGDKVALMHSRLSAGERYDEWRRLRLGIAKVAVGARSAVFAPVANLRIIIVDEEHESSYQSETSPRYSALDVAIRRCAMSGATLILGSATPSISDYVKAKHGIYTLLELKKRISDTPMPKVAIADMRNEFISGNTSVFSNKLYEELETCLENGEQAILFLNRRGYSTFVSCRGCGHVFKCVNCDISMTYHKFTNAMKCHYCGHTETIPKTCPECGEPYIKFFGIGTQQVEEQLKNYFPGVTCLRMDIDTTSTKNAHSNILGAFERGEAQVLIGTQMVAKGLDIPNVTLVGVIAADSMLYIPDYRSSERTFQLITQVAGRAGRRKRQGRVVIQTYSPEHPSILYASNHDFLGFYNYEVQQRKKALFPPYSLFVRILLTSEDENSITAMADWFAQGLNAAIISAIVGAGGNPAELLKLISEPAPIRRKQGVFRHQIIIKFARTKRLSAIISAIYDYHQNNRRSEIGAVEINPSDMF